MWKRCGQCRTASSWTGPVLAASRIAHNFVLFSLVALALCGRAHAAEPAQPKYGWREMWVGGDAMRDVWLLYTGVTLAPWSEHVYDPGFRLRAHSGFGQFNYELAAGPVHESFKGTVNYADALVGYHWRLGDLTAKAFAGIAAIDRNGVTSSARRDLFRLEYGPKLMLELWLNVGDTQWTSLNLSFTTAHDTASARWRYGFKLSPEFSIGPEVRFDTSDFRPIGNTSFFDHYLTRVGAFATYKWPGIELSVAGGIGSRFQGIERSDDKGITPYGTFNVLVQY